MDQDNILEGQPIKFNIRGSIIEVDPRILEQYPDSALEAIISGRQLVEIED